MTFADNIKNVRKSVRLNQEEFAQRINDFSERNKGERTSFNKTNISKWENGKVEPRMDTIRLIASAFEVSPNYLMGMSKKPYYSLNSEDEKDIQKDLERMIQQIESGFYSEETSQYSDETKELIIASLEQAVRIAKIEAKRKYTPKNYK